eukprot:TRINITY_DN48086_c0_g1_i1.p1 TRINITY_DN48086_c0_g1~~TRINITY_DN48086_c0_g1_i1.p1  ORF type:complete len:206 (+),score=56.20 TRINITY_DN48086_c0_g1_i1:1-618(+)
METASRMGLAPVHATAMQQLRPAAMVPPSLWRPADDLDQAKELGQAIFEFFSYYALVFEPARDVACIRHAAPPPSKASLGGVWAQYPLLVRDPYEEERNLVRNMTLDRVAVAVHEFQLALSFLFSGRARLPTRGEGVFLPPTPRRLKLREQFGTRAAAEHLDGLRAVGERLQDPVITALVDRVYTVSLPMDDTSFDDLAFDDLFV